MRITNLALACCLLATATASAQTAPSDPAAPPTTPPPAPDPATPPPPSPPPDPNAPPQPLGGTGDQPPVFVEPQPQPQPQPQPPPPPPPTETTTVTTTTTSTPATPTESKSGKSHWTRARCKGGSGSYYKCERGHGIFHSSRLAVGALSGDAATTAMDPTTGTETTSYGGVTAGQIAFEGAYLGVPSSFAPTNFHGIELSTGLRSSKFDFWLSFGTAFTLLNVGSGGIGTFRLGGSFGAGFDLAHGYGYIKGRGAMIILPERLDVEVSAQWTPVSASTDHYDVQAYRISGWYRLNEKSGRAIEVYLEKLTRKNTFRPNAMDPALAMFADDREILDGVGFGVGMSFF